MIKSSNTEEEKGLIEIHTDYNDIDQIYDECINYLKATIEQNFVKYNKIEEHVKDIIHDEEEPLYEAINNDLIEDEVAENELIEEDNQSLIHEAEDIVFDVINEISDSQTKLSNQHLEGTSNERLRKLSLQLPKIVITQSDSSVNAIKGYFEKPKETVTMRRQSLSRNHFRKPNRYKPGYGDFPRRLVSKSGVENVALISNVPYEKIRLLNDTFHTLINLRWRYIVSGTIVVHFTIWFVFAVFWYITALAHYDFDPDPPKKTCITGGIDFLTIFLASVEAQTTIGFGDRTIDEECPESIFLFIMQLILGTGLSGVLTCVVYAKLTRPEKLSRDGVGFSKKAVVSIRDGKLCLMIRTWDLNYDHIISSEFNAHFINTYRTKEGEVIRYYARDLELQQRQFLLWPVTLVHVIDSSSPLYHMSPIDFANNSYEITVSLKGASASMGTFTQSQTSYLSSEVAWGYRFPPVVKYDHRKQKYAIDHKKLDMIEPITTPMCCASQMFSSIPDDKSENSLVVPGTPGSFSDKISGFHLERSSSFRKKTEIKA